VGVFEGAVLGLHFRRRYAARPGYILIGAVDEVILGKLVAQFAGRGEALAGIGAGCARQGVECGLGWAGDFAGLGPGGQRRDE
jgi:hypothetical protein